MFVPGRQRSRALLLAVAAYAATATSGCAPTTSAPSPRPIVIFSGARLSASPERMELVDAWVRAEMANIQEDPSFMIETTYMGNIVYPWEDLELVADTAKVSVQGRAVDARTPFLIYAHLHLMKKMGRIDEWLPGASALEGYALERAILARVSDVWLYGRTVFDSAPHLPLEELVYANENGYLDAFLFTARPEDFPEEVDAWQKERPNEQARYIAWFQETFQDQPPGLRPETGVTTVAEPDSAATVDTTGARRR